MFMTSKEVHFRDFSYNSNTQELGLSWRLEEDLIPYKCDLLQVSHQLNSYNIINYLLLFSGHPGDG